MLRDKIQTWLSNSKSVLSKAEISRVAASAPRFSDWLHRAELTFERESGWKPRVVKETLHGFSRLSRRNQWLLGGLLVGQALFPNGHSTGKTSPSRANGKEKSGSHRRGKKSAPAVTETSQNA